MARTSWVDEHGRLILLNTTWSKGNYALYVNGQCIGHVYRSGSSKVWRQTVAKSKPSRPLDYPTRKAAVKAALAFHDQSV
jgi:hypothetical protein